MAFLRTKKTSPERGKKGQRFLVPKKKEKQKKKKKGL